MTTAASWAPSATAICAAPSCAGVTLRSPITELMNVHPVVITTDTDRESTLRIMREKVLRHIPVVDREGKVTALRTLEEFIQRRTRDNWVVINGRRRGHASAAADRGCPKPMLKLGDRPLWKSSSAI
jgi:CBS domain-containing protein